MVPFERPGGGSAIAHVEAGEVVTVVGASAAGCVVPVVSQTAADHRQIRLAFVVVPQYGKHLHSRRVQVQCVDRSNRRFVQVAEVTPTGRWHALIAAARLKNKKRHTY